MNTIETIRAHIDQQYEGNREKARYDDYYRGMNDGLDKLEQFLDSLPEQPASEGLEEEIKRYGKEEMPVFLESDLNDIARHFAEWGAEHAKQKPELVQHPAISYMYDADADRDEQIKQAILALLKSDLIQVAGRGFTKQDLIGWVEKK